MLAAGVCVAGAIRAPGRRARVTFFDYRECPPARRATVLAELRRAYNLGRARCATLLDEDEYSLLLTEAPEVRPEELKSAVRWRIKDLISFHINDATLDVFDLPGPVTAGKPRSMYVVAARNDAIRSRVELLNSAAINLQVIDIPEMAQRNLASVLAEDLDGVLFLSLGARGGLITVSRQSEIYLTRRLDAGLDALARAGDLTGFFDRVVLEAQRSLDYYDGQFRQTPIRNLVVAPIVGEIPGLVEYLNANLNVRATELDLGQALDWDTPMPARALGPCLFTLGAALRYEEKAL